MGLLAKTATIPTLPCQPQPSPPPSTPTMLVPIAMATANWPPARSVCIMAELAAACPYAARHRRPRPAANIAVRRLVAMLLVGLGGCRPARRPQDAAIKRQSALPGPVTDRLRRQAAQMLSACRRHPASVTELKWASSPLYPLPRQRSPYRGTPTKARLAARNKHHRHASRCSRQSDCSHPLAPFAHRVLTQV